MNIRPSFRLSDGSPGFKVLVAGIVPEAVLEYVNATLETAPAAIVFAKL